MKPEAAQQVGRHVAAIFGLAPGARTLVTAPMYHTAPNVQATFAVALGLDVHVMVKFEPEAALRQIDDAPDHLGADGPDHVPPAAPAAR